MNFKRKGMFTLYVCLCVTINSNANIDADNGLRPILCVYVCVTSDAMLNFDRDVDVDANADVACEQSVGTKLMKEYLNLPEG